MARVSGFDMRRILEFLVTVRVGSPADPLPSATLVALGGLLGADDADYFELRLADRKPLAFSESTTCEAVPGTEEAMIAFGAQNPLGWRRWSPADGALRLSTRIGRRERRRREWFGEFMEPNKLTDMLKVWLWRSPESIACLQLWRHGGEFSQRDQDVLGVLHQDLVRLRATALAGGSTGIGQHVAGEALTAREAEALIWAIRGHSHAEIAERFGAAPATVGKHLERAYEKLGVRNRGQAVERLLLSGPLD